MDTYVVELEEAEGRFIGTVQAVPGLLVFGASVDEVLERAHGAIAFRVGEDNLIAAKRRANIRMGEATHRGRQVQA